MQSACDFRSLIPIGGLGYDELRVVARSMGLANHHVENLLGFEISRPTGKATYTSIKEFFRDGTDPEGLSPHIHRALLIEAGNHVARLGRNLRAELIVPDASSSDFVRTHLAELRDRLTLLIDQI